MPPAHHDVNTHTRESAPTVFTVGHGARTLDELFDVLRAGGVTRVLDVRAHPGSRRHPHFGRDALARALPEQGIAYEWRGEVLGGRRRAHPGSRHGAWREPSFRAYADHVDTPELRAAVERLAADAGAGARDAVMCSETLWWRCHRRLVADALVTRGVRVVHLLSPSSSQEHALAEIARVGDDGWPVWDVGVLPLT